MGSGNDKKSAATQVRNDTCFVNVLERNDHEISSVPWITPIEGQ